MMESIEKLREFVDDQFVYSGQAYLQGMAIAGSIESEIAERYMLLPVDADGVPIRVGDHMECDGEAFTVCAVAPGRVHRWKVGIIGESETVSIAYPPCQCRHVKPRTIEDVLREFAEKCAEGSLVCEEADVRKYADEIRELMEVDR